MTDTERETIGSRLRRLRTLAKLTQRQLARKVGLSQAAIAGIESDRRGYGSGVVDIARVLNTTAAYLLLNRGGVPVALSPEVALARRRELLLADVAIAYEQIVDESILRKAHADGLAAIARVATGECVTPEGEVRAQ